MKTAVVDAGGGLRGIYAAGVMDWCMDHKIDFDLCIGVSAGSANMSSYVAGQKGRNYKFYRDYSGRKEYMSMENFQQKHNYVDVDYIYGDLSNTNGEYPLDYKAIQKSEKDLYVVCTNALTARPVYFDKSWMKQDQYDIFKASCSIPVVNQPYLIRNVPFFDGALSDPIPMDKAFELGAEKVVVLVSRPADKPRNHRKDYTLSLFMEKYPEAARALRTRIDKYNETVEKAKVLEKEGKVLLLAPDSTCGVDTLKRDEEALHSLYLKGYSDAARIAAFLQEEAPAS